MQILKNVAFSASLFLILNSGASATSTCSTPCPDGNSFLPLKCGGGACSGTSGVWQGAIKSSTAPTQIGSATSVKIMTGILSGDPACYYDTDHGEFMAYSSSLKNCTPDMDCAPLGFNNCKSSPQKKKQ